MCETVDSAKKAELTTSATVFANLSTFIRLIQYVQIGQWCEQNMENVENLQALTEETE